MKMRRKKTAIGVRSQAAERGEQAPKEPVKYSADHTCILKGPFPIEYGNKKEDAEK